MDNTTIKIETFVSVVLILDDIVTGTFEEYLKELQLYLDQRYSYYEIIIIDQNSKLAFFLSQNRLNGVQFRCLCG